MRLKCTFAGCVRLRRRNGLCDSHDHQAKRGIALKPIGEWCAPRALRENPSDPNTLLVPLPGGRVAIIDKKDGEAVGTRNWSAHPAQTGDLWYAQSHAPGGRKESLHRFLWSTWGRPPTPEIDHQNNDGLDCRSVNLRPATMSQNRWNARKRADNQSGHKGVDRHSGKWRARIAANGKKIFLGCFDDVDQAASAVASARARLHAEFARSV